MTSHWVINQLLMSGDLMRFNQNHIKTQKHKNTQGEPPRGGAGWARSFLGQQQCEIIMAATA